VGVDYGSVGCADSVSDSDLWWHSTFGGHSSHFSCRWWRCVI